MALKNKQSKTIVLPMSEKEYDSFISDNEIAHEQLQLYYKEYPKLFPQGMDQGYMLNGYTRRSKKLGIRMRKVKVLGISYRIRPSFILPYFRAKTDEVSKPMFLIRFGVPFWALAYVFGRNAMWWYRLYICLGRFSIVGTTIQDKADLPQDILADEHHIKVRGKKAYIATTVAKNCFLGMAACPGADEASLRAAYGVFKAEAGNLDAHYQPNTVNTDGWWATQKAWKWLYPKTVIIECFLHAFLKVRDRATKKLQDYFNHAADKIWNCYRALSKRQLGQQIRRLKQWAEQQMPDCPMKQNIFKLCKKKKKWMAHFDVPQAHRTSNMLDRLMRAMNRHAFNSQMFHSTISSTSMNFRAFALLYNFSPSSPQVTNKAKGLDSPAARLNGFSYHDDWLQNLLTSASLGRYHNHRNLL